MNDDYSFLGRMVGSVLVVVTVLLAIGLAVGVVFLLGWLCGRPLHPLPPGR